MGKSLYSTKVAMGALALLGYLGNVNSAEAQQPANQNRILSRNSENSVTGDGVLLKDFIYNINLVPGSKFSLDRMFELYAQKGNVRYSVVGGREGLKAVLADLRRNKNPTEKEIASIKYIDELSRVWESDTGSVNALERAVQDRVIDAAKEAKNVRGGRYLIKAVSQTVGEARGNTVYIIADIKNGSYVPGKKVPSSQTSQTQSSKDSLAKVARAKFTRDSLSRVARAKEQARNKYVADSIKSETAMRDNLANERRKIDSLTKFSREMAERQKYLADSTAEAIAGNAREKYVRDSTVADSTEKADARKKFVRDSIADRRKFVFDSTEKSFKERAEKLRTRFGVEAGYGMRNEGVLGAFVEVPLAPGLSAEFYANYHVQRGNPNLLKSKTDTTLRETQLIAGTYKTRVDEMKTSPRQSQNAEVGLGALLFPQERVSLSFRTGAGFVEEESTLDGKSTIYFERNMVPLGTPQVITNTKEGPRTKKTGFAWSAGADFKVTDNLSLGVSVNGAGKNNSQRINLKWKF